MRILTNPGSNLTPALVERYDLDITPQQIVVDGTHYDTRDGIDPKLIDRWVLQAREHPYVPGTSAAEFIGVFKELSRNDRQVLAVMTSRKLIQSYDAAVSASRTLAKLTGDAAVEVGVLDSGVTDAGAGLATLMAALAREAGLSMARTQAVTDRFCREMGMRLYIANMENTIKGGASFLRGWLANILRIRPILTFNEGELEVAAKISTKADPIDAIAQIAEEQFAGRRVWVSVSHGDAPERGERLAQELRRRLQPELLYVRPYSPSIYLHAGRDAVGWFVAPIDRLGWEPPRIDPTLLD